MTGVDQLSTAVDRTRLALSVPFLAALGMQLAEPGRPSAGVLLSVSALAGNGAGGAHASAPSAALELATDNALAPSLTAEEHAVPHAGVLQLVAAARAGTWVQVTDGLSMPGTPAPGI